MASELKKNGGIHMLHSERARPKTKIGKRRYLNKINNSTKCRTSPDTKTPSAFIVLTDSVEILESNDIPKSVVPLNSQKYEHVQIDKNQVVVNSKNASLLVIDAEVAGKEIKINRMVDGKQNELNAFHILMPRNKSMNSLGLDKSTSEDEIFTAKKNPELDLMLNHNKDVLGILSDRKRCVKRKIPEEGEGAQERIKKRLNDRSKISECTIVKNHVQTNPTISHGLHNYFTRISSQAQQQTEDVEMVVEDVTHETDTASLEPPHSKINENGVKLKVRQVLNAIEGIQNLQSEASSSLSIQKIKLKQAQQEPQCTRKKSKWSLRINFQSSDEDYNIIDGEIINKGKSSLKNRVKCDERRTSKGNPSGKLNKQEKSRTITIEADTEVNDVKNGTNTTLLATNKRTNNSTEGNSSTKEVVINSNNKTKIAPLFVKRLKADARALAARTFLHSQPLENKERKSECKSHVSTTFTPFPSISHVVQCDFNPQADDACNFKYRNKKINISQPDPTHLKCMNSYIDIIPKDIISVNSVGTNGIETILQEIEQRCIDTREMWKTILTITNKVNVQLSPKKSKPRQRSTDKKISQLGNMNVNQADTWTRKYRPLSTKEVTGNEEAALKLGNWLREWKSLPKGANYNSSDEFHCADNSCNFLENNQVAVLLGPHGSGKTASVYAVAEELGYKVLEVNASSKRTGKKILKELEEATKSHRVKQKNSGATRQLVLNSDKNVQKKNSLILIEDVDLIFNEDEGFIPAISQIALNTKRPIIMTCESECFYLSRMAPQRLQIYFRTISGSRAMALMELIALAETGFPIPRPCLEKLMAYGDLRKALLKLQYLLLSGTSHSIECSTNFEETLWQDMRSYIYKSILNTNRKQSIINHNHVDDGKTVASRRDLDTVTSLADDLDVISLVSSLTEIKDPTLDISQIEVEPSLSLGEIMDSYSKTNLQSTEISTWLRNHVMHKYAEENDIIDTKISSQLLNKKELNSNVKLALSQISMNTLDSRILSVDHLPIVRTICRAEDVKVGNNMKRKNRFFHYLQNFSLPSASNNINILEAACKIMHESIVK